MSEQQGSDPGTGAPITVETGKGRIPLDDLGRAQPGLSRTMAELSPRVSNVRHAARAGNWPLATYFYKTSLSLMRDAVLLRPKYAEAMEEFIRDAMAPIRTAIDAQDPFGFERAFAAMVESTHDFHARFNKAYLRWQVPAEPPADLDFGLPASPAQD